MRALPVLALLLLAACAETDPRTAERLACLGDDPQPACKAIWERDLGPLPGGGGGGAAFTAPAAGPGSTGTVRLPAGGVCSLSGRAYPVGASTLYERTGDVRGVGMVIPRPGDGMARRDRCTCQARPGGGATWSCR